MQLSFPFIQGITNLLYFIEENPGQKQQVGLLGLRPIPGSLMMFFRVCLFWFQGKNKRCNFNEFYFRNNQSK